MKVAARRHHREENPMVARLWLGLLLIAAAAIGVSGT